ncbi:hypothetical protein [Nostoc sp. 'Peltigera malacea cyanobiont' DB3992]|uniref:hypothetical protein n=1 Tax=Nostoc sp. 'Peltigera malacea cyanobiont' DB3992 TaxID=1206980 RepID=UPI000C05792E|nr:hypothetical protein [Nostoc sp. 'Peltigera malacea cyanobiont' DB3992]PHM09262.1 hypothetical protein CK516_15720 [Nostoc sp. 'Peltigera malacea cyanobiont' DB3992]
MFSPNLLEIERSILALSVEEQLWLLESIVRQIREREYVKDNFNDDKNLDEQLQVTATLPNIKTQIATINDEFASSEIL